MAYSVNWYIKNEIIYVHYSDAMTAEEYRDCLIMVRDLIESSPRHMVHVISDVGDVSQAVPLKDVLAIVRELGSPPQIGWSLTIREKSVFIKIAAALGTSIFRFRARTFDTLDEALDHLKAMDTALSWDKVAEY